MPARSFPLSRESHEPALRMIQASNPGNRGHDDMKKGSVLEVQQNRAQAKSHGMRVMRNVTESFGEDAHHDREKA
jgi:hypothetical protein